MSWSIAAVGIGTVSLTKVDSVSESNPARVAYFDPDGGMSDVFSEGQGVRTLSLGGAFYVSGQNNSYLESTFLSPLRNMVGTAVTVTSPDSQYNGTWLLAQFDPQRTLDALNAYYWSLKLVKGNSLIIL